MPFTQPQKWNAPEVDAIGSNLTIAAGNTLNASGGGGGGITSIVVQGGLHPQGTITSAGTIAALWNFGTVDVTALGGALNQNGSILSDQKQGTLSLSGTTTGTINPANVDSFLVNVGTANGTVSISPGSIGQRLRLDIKQGATPHTVSFDSSVVFGATFPSYTATNTAGDVDEIALFMAQDGTHWRFSGVAQGFTL